MVRLKSKRIWKEIIMKQDRNETADLLGEKKTIIIEITE